MAALLILFVWALNFGISWLNARYCGLVWAETKVIGGWQRFMTWMGAIMSASGFTWCYLIALLFGAYWSQPLWLEEDQAPVLGLDAIQAGLQLGYLIIIPGILFSGLMIWIDSLIIAWRNRDWRSVGVASWNTFAQVHNTFSAMRGIPDALSGVGKFFSGKGDGKGKAGLLVILLVLLAVAGGIATTYALIKKYAGSRPLPEFV